YFSHRTTRVIPRELNCSSTAAAHRCKVNAIFGVDMSSHKQQRRLIWNKQRNRLIYQKLSPRTSPRTKVTARRSPSVSLKMQSCRTRDTPRRAGPRSKSGRQMPRQSMNTRASLSRANGRTERLSSLAGSPGTFPAAPNLRYFFELEG